MKLLLVRGHVGGLFTCRHKYDINAGAWRARDTWPCHASLRVTSLHFFCQNRIRFNQFYGSGNIFAHPSQCVFDSWLVSQTLIYHQISDIILLIFNIDIHYPSPGLNREQLWTCWRIIRLWLNNFTHHSLWVWNIAAGVSDKCFPRRDYPFIHYWYPRISRSRDSRFYLESHHAHASHHRIWKGRRERDKKQNQRASLWKSLIFSKVKWEGNECYWQFFFFLETQFFDF